MIKALMISGLLLLPAACMQAGDGPRANTPETVRVASADTALPQQGQALPRMRWSHRPKGDVWTRDTLKALSTHGQSLPRTVPADIDAWCPAYRENNIAERAAFWAGLMSAMAKHESTYKQAAVGGGGKWYGLLQISPATARGYGCRATSGAALKNGSDNLSCAVRIMARTVPRDGVIAEKGKRWRGVAADWGPMRVPSKRRDMQAWLRERSYCQLN